MKDIRDIPLDKIVVSPELEKVQGLMPMHDTDKGNLFADIEKNGIRDPLKAYTEGGKVYLLAGLHRLDAARKFNFNTVPVELLKIKPDERENFCVHDNLNRRHLTREDKQRLIDYFLVKQPELSNRAIADKVKVDHKTVGDRRKEKEEGGEIPHHETRTGKDGIKQPSEKPKRNNPSVKRPPEVNKSMSAYLDSYVKGWKGADREAVKALLIKYIKNIK